MRKITLVLLMGSLAAIPSVCWADTSANFEPVRKADMTSTNKPQPAAKAPVTPPAAKKTTAPVSKPATAAVAPVPAVSPEAALVAQEEVVRRQASQVQARVLIDEGQKLYAAGKYDQAISKLNDAIKLLPRAKATDTDYNRADRLLSDSYANLANSALTAKDLPKASALAKKSLEYDAHNSAAENVVVKVKKEEFKASQPPVVPPPDATPEFQASKSEIRKLFREGKLLMNSGQFDEAEKRFQQVLLLDPYNADAYQLLQQVTADRQPSTNAGTDAARSHMLWEADQAWIAPISGEIKPPVLGKSGGPLAGASAASSAILAKLNEIVFPEIKFRDASITDVVQYLGDESRKLDPKHEGVNIVLGAGVGGGASEPLPAAPAPEPGAPGAPAAPAPSTGGGGGRTITLNLHNVPMIAALNYITQLANLKYRVESSAVLIVQANEPEGQMITRTYPVTPGAFSIINTAGTAAGGGGNAARSGGEEFVRIGTGTGAAPAVQDVKALFEGAGIAFPQGATIVYNDRTSTLIVKNTPENIELLERVLPAFIDVPKQIEIEAKFVEVSQNDLDELGFRWKVGSYQSGDIVMEGGQPSVLFPGGGANPDANGNNISGGIRDSSAISGSAIGALLGATGIGAGGSTIGSIRGILTNPQFEVLITAISRKTSADVLSAPKVTTISGVQAQIKVVQEFIYPTEYSEPQTGNGGITPSIPSSFKTREVGVVLNVTPTVGADNYTINLTLIPEVSEFLGFLDYSPGNVTTIISSNSTGGGTGNAVQNVPIVIKQPLFSSRNVTTSVVLWDGQTVVLGGLIREEISKIDDKIPFLGDLPLVGRLFRSKVTQRTKRNLLIFVTARLIDPAGNPIHKENLRAGIK
jgi:general secretion pathway protein D